MVRTVIVFVLLFAALTGINIAGDHYGLTQPWAASEVAK